MGLPPIGRNAPCPCGSGRKYKVCCLSRGEADRTRSADRPPVHERDGEFVERLANWGLRSFGEACFGFLEDLDDMEEEASLVWPWSVYGCRIQGRAIVAWYLDAERHRLPIDERRWLEAQRDAWLSVWEVRDVEPGVSLLLEGLLTGETRRVLEVAGSRALYPRAALLARVVDFDGRSYLCGNHPCPLPPRAAATVVERARTRLRRRREVPLNRMRDDVTGRALIRYWEDALDDLADAAAAPRELVNTDGDPILVTKDRFTIAPGAGAAVEAGLARAGGEPRECDDDLPFWIFLAPPDPAGPAKRRLELGRAWIDAAQLVLETNSRKRADALRARVEAATGAAIRHRTREHTDPLSERAREDGQPPPAEPMPPEIQRVVREHKRRHYAAWIDDALPALGGKTPRDSVRTAAGRRAVEVMLKEIEVLESDIEPGARFDVNELRRALGLA